MQAIILILANIFKFEKNSLKLSFWEIINFLRKKGIINIFWWFYDVLVKDLRMEQENWVALKAVTHRFAHALFKEH